MAAAAEQGSFYLIIADVESARVEEAAAAFAKAFSLDVQIAAQIVKSAPIIFASELSKGEIKAITPSLRHLSSVGMEFRVTGRIARKIPKVNWPVRPQFTAGGVSGTNGLAFRWENNAFVCPGCGETFLFRRLGRLPLSDAAEQAVSRAQAAASASLAAAKQQAAARPKPAAAPPPSGEEPEIEPELSLDEPGTAEPAADLDADLEFGEPAAGETALSEDTENLSGEESSGADLPVEAEEISLDEEDLGGAEDLTLDENLELVPPEGDGTETSGESSFEEPSSGELSEAVEEEVPAAAGDLAVASGEMYNVFLSKISDRKKQQKAATVIAEVKRCTEQEARELASRLVIPLAKNVSKEQAEDILSKFKKLKIFGRMTRAK